ncbi:MAG: peptidoglycan bridge formation glycyltransferase FemA/FemB family protein [bacterium]|nr:peptidoglycan bridge formation glycyltransferase FemA/FemB family protein [bacterium]MDZ4295910.1 peptidoglycan bridge formation glycyltransferase FemA/FemB family protein [Patescibacteria group bacterium]
MDDTKNLPYEGDAWNRFVTAHNGSFLQSREWGEFQQAVGRRIQRFAFIDEEMKPWEESVQKSKIRNQSDYPKFKDEEPGGVIQFAEMPLAPGLRYWYAPRGPVVNEYRMTNDELRSLVLETLISKATIPHNVLFVRLEPPWREGEFVAPPSWQRTASVQPKENWVLDLTPPEAELLAAMHPKTRYNVRLAEKEADLSIRRGDPAADFDAAWTLLEHTAERQEIRLHPRQYYERMLAMPIAEIWIAEYKRQPVAAHILIRFGGTFTYLHGGSSYEHRALMAPQLLHWKAIRESKARGYHTYDFGGTDGARWPGLTRFKQGFGGRQIVFVGAFDRALRPYWYRLYRTARRLMRH